MPPHEPIMQSIIDWFAKPMNRWLVVKTEPDSQHYLDHPLRDGRLTMKLGKSQQTSSHYTVDNDT